jgi:predicted  nucleic acid-binding Zn-ribbon protein
VWATMTMSQAETERKIHQLDGDVQSIYEMLATIEGTQRRHGNRLQELAAKADGLEAKLDALDTKVAALDTKMDTVLALLGGSPPAQG